MPTRRTRTQMVARVLGVLLAFTVGLSITIAARPYVHGKASGPLSLAAEPTCLDPEMQRSILEMRLRLSHARARLQLLTEEFVDLLGPPQHAPPDLDPRYARDALEAVLDELRPLQSAWVDCSVYPCAIVVRSSGDGQGLRSLQELKDWLVDRGYSHLITTGSTLDVLHGPGTQAWSIAVLPAPPDVSEERWARSVAVRAMVRTRHEDPEP